MNIFDVGVLDLAKQCNDEPARVILRRGDKNATTITATITDHGDPADTTGLSARFSMRLPDMAHYYSKAATLDGNAVSITINEEQAASTVGKTSIAFFELLDASGNLIASTSAFDVIVLMGAMDGTGIAESYSDELDVAMQQLAEAREDYEEMREDAQAAIDAANAAAESATIVSTIQAAESATQAATSAAQTASQAASDATDAAQAASQTAASIALAEQGRVQAEQARVTAESARATAEQSRAAAESSRAEAEQSRASAESSRVTAEQARTTAESSRAAAESARVTAEASRDDAEQARVTAESARATAEQSRAAAESSRAEAELGRATAESARVTAESARATAETTRATAEQSRATAETARASAESVRVTAEQGRASAENARASAESARVTAESARASAETSRATAETARASAETARATEWAEIEPAAQSATTAAQSATQSATVAAALATRAAAAATAAVAAASNGNVPYGTLTGTVLTADDAWSAFAKSVGVYGKSAQAGTPTPDAPVAIQSVDDLTLHVCGKNLFDPSHILDASGWTVSNDIYTGMSNELFNKYGPNTSGYPISGLASEAQSYTMSLDYTPSDATKSTFIRFEYTDGTSEARAITLSAAGHYTGTTNPNKILAKIFFSYSSTQSISLSNIQIELGSTETSYEPYIGQSVPVPLSDHIARSLPDGTEDSLTLSYIGPSTEHEGWGVFSKTLQQLIGSTTTAATDGITGTVGVDVLSTTGEIADGPTVIYKLATPITHDLGTVELPILPNPLTAWADGGSAQPTMSMGYERSLSIVIPRIEAAISDLATS